MQNGIENHFRPGTRMRSAFVSIITWELNLLVFRKVYSTNEGNQAPSFKDLILVLRTANFGARHAANDSHMWQRSNVACFLSVRK